MQTADLTIAALGASGDGVAELDGHPAYVPFTLVGEQVRARVSGERGELEAVLQPSAHRVAPPCPHFGRCGGCALQHFDPAPYLAWKVEQVRLALGRERIETEFATPFAAAPGSRRRLALHARKSGRHVTLGYKARGTWDLVEIAVCAIAEPRLVAALPALAACASPLFEHAKSAPILHVTSTLTGLDVDVSGVEARRGGLSADSRRRVADAAQAGGLARLTLAGEALFQARRPIVRFGAASVAPPPGGFLQAVEAAEVAMAAFACEAIQGADRVADLYCGSGAFSFRLAETASVLAIDGTASAVEALRQAIATAPGLKQITTEARDLARRPLLAMEMKRLDAVLFDPPRAGALEQVREIAPSKVSRAVGVSCNPATFARDARVLVDAGFHLTRVLPVDQFLWSPHIELVGVFER
ncbi:class I SAM-dependent RNA methyltransferase [Caulobacter sp. S45]|uniref:class I SAM-dependent RNA methyltransferase n=1 Tax=Caulobacter sp. S45 TaxID=1641861 RepID=UPI0015760D96|nr:class I SAM-dependent RNA methyltransferase [Caulobacter sp. S45]